MADLQQAVRAHRVQVQHHRKPPFLHIPQTEGFLFSKFWQTLKGRQLEVTAVCEGGDQRMRHIAHVSVSASQGRLRATFSAGTALARMVFPGFGWDSITFLQLQ